METIKWVVTPPCRYCAAPPEFRRRYSCIGCEKFHRKNAPQVTFAKHKLANADRQRRNAHIAALRKDGLSYEHIARMLKMPRATVQSAAATVMHESSL